MDATGGSYLSMPNHNSYQINRSLKWPSGALGPSLLKHREPIAPYALHQGAYKPPGPPPGRVVHYKVAPTGPLNPHRSPNGLPNRPGVTDVSRHAPYAARLESSHFMSVCNYPKAVNGAPIPSYDSLSDPHLQEYYIRKFANPHPPKGSGRPGSAKSGSSRTGGKNGKSGKYSDKTGALYKIAVCTGDKKGASTDARVCIRIIGTKGKLPKKHLNKKTESKSKKKARFKFNRGTTHIFKMDGKDIGEVMSVVIEHDGLTKEEGWYLEQIEIIKKVYKSGKEQSWIFTCQQWLSLHMGDCQISRELFAKSYSKTEYEIVVVTGNLKGSGTDANVSVTLYGKTGQTPKLPLKSNAKTVFERGQSDVFTVKSAAVGPLTKLRIQHDNTGFGPGWFLDRVVVTDLKNPKWKYYFPCGMWLAKDESDGAISRDLIGSKDPLAVRKSNKYKVTVYTGNKRGAGTDANVYCTLFGDTGESGERKLDTNRNNFEKNQVDEFFIECPSLGTLKKLRIGHDNSGMGAAWYLDKVIVDDMETNRVYEFPCDRWFAKNEDDGAISRDLLPAGGPGEAPPVDDGEGVPYSIQVTTGDKDNAGTSARVYIIMYGGKDGDENSGKIWLENGQFKRGRTDIFNVEVADMLSPLSRIDIGHDNSGPGAGWFLDKVIINCPSAGCEQYYNCDKWFALDEGDNQIERTLYEQKSLRKTRKKKDVWHVAVYTSDTRGAGTDANVWMVVYGHHGKDREVRKSDEIKLDNKGDNFESGQVDKFKVELDEIGRPFKMRIGHDNSGAFAGWHLDKVVLENMATHKQYTFTCNRWLADDEDDGSIIREMPAEGEDIKRPQPLLQYQVAVHTGSKSGAGTDANVFCNVFGDQGDAGERPLTKSKTNSNKFENGNVDEFIVEAVNLKKLKKIRIGHDGENAGAGWFLDKVVVTPLKDPEGETVFECNRWLDIKEDDGLIVREITAGGSQMLSTTSYHVSVKTGDIWGGGTDANVYLKIFGDKGDTGTLNLMSADNTSNKFERGRTDQFRLEATDIGKISHIRIGHDGSKPGSGWFLDEVRLDVPSKGMQYVFACHRWLDTKEEDGQIEVELEPTDTMRGSAKIPYEVTVWTGDMKGGGTDANVFLQMYGEYGKTEEYSLRNRTDNFEQGQVDKFKIEAEDVGPLLKIRTGHDGSKMFDGWFLDKILIQRHPVKGSKRRRKPPKQTSAKTISRSVVDSDSDTERKKKRKKKRFQDDSDDERSRSRSGRRKRRDSDSDLENMNPFGSARGKGGRRKSGRFSDDSDGESRGRRPASAKGGRRPASAKGDRRLSRSNNRWSDEEDDRKSSKSRARGKKGRFSDEDSDWERKSSKSRARGKKGRFSDDDSDWERKSYKSTKSKKGRNRYSDFEDSEDDRKSKRSKNRRDYDDWEDDRKSTRSGKSKKKSRYSDDEDDMNIFSSRNRRKSHSLAARDYSDDDVKSSKKRSKSESKSRFSDSEDESPRSRRRPSSAKRSRREREMEEEEEKRKEKERKNKKNMLRKSGREESEKDGEEDTEDYWFVCNRWFARDEDDKKIVRELLPTDERGNPLDTGLQELDYVVKVYTGDIRMAGTDANVFINITGEYGDTGERELKGSQNINKFERNQEDVFKLTAIELGKLKKVKIRHDNKGAGGDWFLGHVEIDDPKNNKTYFFPCQRWLATGKDDGQIARELVAVDQNLKKRLNKQDSFAIRNEVALETKAAMTTYHVNVFTSDKRGAGTDANVHIILFGEIDDTGKMMLKSSKTNRDKFERAQRDEFVIEAVDIGEIRKIRIGHDNSGIGGDWMLDRVEIDAPSLGRKWYFPCGRWLAKGKDDGQLERELYPQDIATEEYVPCIPYEITTYTSDIRGSSTNADVFIVLYGRDIASQQKSLAASKHERKSAFERAAVDKFVVELEDVGETIEKIRIGHDSAGFGAGWHLNKVEIRRLKETGKKTVLGGSETHTFLCNRWLAKDEDDGAIVRELVPEEVFEEVTRKDGTVKKKKLERRDTLTSKKYLVNVYTGDIRGAGTDANVFLTMYGEKGDSGERKLAKSETHKDKFERGQLDKFNLEAIDLGKVFCVKIRHDNSMLSPAWFLDKVEVIDSFDNETYTFHCERWLAKNKDDMKIERRLFVKGYEGPMSSTSTLRSNFMSGSVASFDSLNSFDPFSKSPRVSRRQMEDMPDGPTIPYTVKVITGPEKNHGTDSNVFIKIMGGKKRHTGKQFLEQASKRGFEPGSIETFSLEAVDVKEVKQIEVGHDGVQPGTGWYLKEVEVDMPTKGKHYFFTCKQWLARDKGDGKTCRVFTTGDNDSASMVTYKPLIPYEVTIETGDVSGAGTDSHLSLKAFGVGGCTSEVRLEKTGEKFERGRSDLVKMELEDVGALKKLRLTSDGKGTRPDWYVDKVEMRNMHMGELTVFKTQSWLSASKGDAKLSKDFVAYVKGKAQLKTTTYRIYVKTSDVRGAGTDANVYLVLFGENGDSGELHLSQSDTNSEPFENNQQDVFSFTDILGLGQLLKCRVWHDNKGFGAAWHLAHIEVEDVNSGSKFMFPCNRWLSKSDDDKQICRELSCANVGTPRVRDKVTYDIEITTSDKKDAGMIHNAWCILEGEERTSKEFIMENSARNKVLRKGQTDSFSMVNKNLGAIERVILGAMERDDKPLGGMEGREAMWHCHEVIVTNRATGDKYIFPCKSWIPITRKISRKNAKVLERRGMEESMLTSMKNKPLGTVKYEVVVVTSDVSRAGTDANVCINIHGDHGDTGKRPLEQKLRNLFERNQTDTFVIEAIDLGELRKVTVEHDNKGWSADWHLDRVEVANMGTNRKWSFPCGQWLSKKKGDGQLSRDLYPRD